MPQGTKRPTVLKFLDVWTVNVANIVYFGHVQAKIEFIIIYKHLLYHEILKVYKAKTLHIYAYLVFIAELDELVSIEGLDVVIRAQFIRSFPPLLGNHVFLLNLTEDFLGCR
jgi:hypothetical protein